MGVQSKLGPLQPPRGVPLLLIQPREGFHPGARYRFTYWPGGTYMHKERRTQFEKWVQELIVDISPDVFDPGMASAIVRVGAASTGKVVTSTNGSGCATRFLGRQVLINIQLPDDLKRWSNALLYTVRVDDKEIWRPDKDLCNPTPPGASSVGLGQELLFSWCDWWPEDVSGGLRSDSGSPSSLLPPGRHSIEFTAWLPGTPEQIVGRAEVELRCNGR